MTTTYDTSDDTLLSGWDRRATKDQEHEDESFSELHNAPDDDHDDLTPVKPRKASKETEERRSQGGRTDWHSVLKQETPPGYRPVPPNTRSLADKQAMGWSFGMAAKRRQARRETTGVPIQYDNMAYKRLGAAGREAFDATKRALGLTTCPETGRRWDWYADFHWSGYVEAHVDHLFRSGSANPQGQQAWVRYHREADPQ